MEEFLKGFSGYLTCDVFNGYNKLKDVIRCSCLAHMRRYWHDALPGKSKKSPDKTPAEIGFDYCIQLFEPEKEYAALDCLVHNKNTQSCRGDSSKLQREFPQ